MQDRAVVLHFFHTFQQPNFYKLEAGRESTWPGGLLLDRVVIASRGAIPLRSVYPQSWVLATAQADLRAVAECGLLGRVDRSGASQIGRTCGVRTCGELLLRVSRVDRGQRHGF